MKLLIMDRPAQGIEDGPQEIVHMMLSSGAVDGFTTIVFNGALFTPETYRESRHDSRVPMTFWSALAWIWTHRGRLRGVEEVSWFGSFNQWFLMIALLLRPARRRVVAYDCLVRTYETAMADAVGFKARLLARLRLARAQLIERTMERARVRTLFVSASCQLFAAERFPRLPSGVIGLMPPPATTPAFAAPAPSKADAKESEGAGIDLDRDILILGPCLSATDVKNARAVLAALQGAGVATERVVLFGRGFAGTEFDGFRKIPFVEDFEAFFANSGFTTVAMRQNAPGIQTKLQKLALLGTKVLVREGIDVNPVTDNILYLTETLQTACDNGDGNGITTRPAAPLDVARWAALYDSSLDLYRSEFS